MVPATLVSTAGAVHAQTPVPVGKGSYASTVPLEQTHGLKALQTFTNLFVVPGTAGRPVPSNQWWTDLIISRYGGELWAHPLTVSADEHGINVFYPTTWNRDGTHMELGTPLRIHGEVSRKPDATTTLLADFEGDTLPAGWVAEGIAFRGNPARGKLPGQTPIGGFIGHGLINTFTDGDRATGVLTSPAFPLTRRFILFRIGGGRDAERLRIELLVDGQAVCTATGANSEDLRLQSWDVSAWKGRPARLRCVDQSTGGWGHLLVDHIVMSDDPADPVSKTDPSFRPLDARALAWGDWTIAFRAAESPTTLMDVTLGHGLPYVWIETRGMTPVLDAGPDLAVFDPQGAPAALPCTGEALGLEVGGRCFGVYAPSGTRFSSADHGLRVAFTATNTYLVVAALPARKDLAALQAHAYAIPRNSRIEWFYDPAAASVVTRWHLDTVPLRGTETATIQGWIPHHYAATARSFAFNGLEYGTARGRMQCATGRDFTVTWQFEGLLPVLPPPARTGRANDYDAARMAAYVADYTNRTDYGDDTYWGGKHLLQYGAYMSMARELGHPAFAVLRDTLRRALADWFTYTPGEKAHYFARYDSWGALVGFSPSSGSEAFTDNHFHYGSFTAAAGLLGLYDPAFLQDYGDMARQVAKQYANWDRSDTRFPFLRTFDIWEGHSWAGGHSSPGGNNQESSSEAMQSWGGLFLLGAALHDNAMTAAGAMGYAMEAESTREYWFDVRAANHPAAYAHSITGILFGNGQAYATYFSGDPAWVHGIQWLPMTPLLAYLSRDPEFARRDFDAMMAERKAKEGRTDIASLGTGLGNVVLSYAAQFDPDWTAARLDELWTANSPVAHDRDTPGMTYYLTHALRSLGRRQWDWHMDPPMGAVYTNEQTHTLTYVAFNATSAPVDVRVFRQGRPSGTFTVPPGCLAKTTTLEPPPGASMKEPATGRR